MALKNMDTLKTLGRAFVQFRSLSLSFLSLNFVMAIMELGGLISMTALLQYFYQGQQKQQASPLALFNIDLPSLSFLPLLSLIVCFQIISTFGNWVRSNLMSRLRFELVTWWSQEILQAFFYSRWDVVSRYKPMQLTHLMSFDLERMGDVFFMSLRMCGTFFLIFTYSAFLWISTSSQVFISLGLVAITFILIKKCLPNPKRSGEVLREKSENTDRFFANFFEGYKHVTLRGKPQLDQAIKNIDHHELAWRNAFLILIKSQMIQRTLSIIITASLVAYAVLILRMEMEQLILIAYLFYRLNPLAQQCLSDLQEWSQSESSFTRTNLVLNDLKSQPRLMGQTCYSDPVDTFEISNLSYAYPHQNQNLDPLIQNMSLNLKRGQLALITGPNGSGKTTFADVMCRLLTPTSGHISINGVPIQDLTMKSWQKQMVYLPQTQFIIEGTLRDNLSWGESFSVPLEESLVNHPLIHWLDHFPKGLDDPLQENDQTISGGMQKKIGLLRTLLHQKPIIILDEPTEHLDPQARQDLVKHIQASKSTSCWIVLSHDPIFLNFSNLELSLAKP